MSMLCVRARYDVKIEKVPTFVPEKWTADEVMNAIEDYRFSISERRREAAAFEARGAGTELGELAHAQRIAKEENFVRLLEERLEELQQ